MRMLQAYPSLPVRDIPASVAFYRDKLGLPPRHLEDGFAILTCDHVELHLWRAGDEGWRSRSADSPVITGAESFIAGTASCRIRVTAVDELHQKLMPLGIVHGNAPLTDQPWGDREFSVLDPDGNLVTFFQPRK